MEKKLKRKCIISFICMVIGIIIIILSLYLKGLSEMQTSYINGFGTSFTIVSFVLFIRNLRSMKNSKTIRDREIELTDERNIEIETKSMAVTFRIAIVLQAIASIILSIFMNNELGMHLGLLVGIQLVIYIISNVVISKKI
ncbi:MAG: hypothetical protein HFJ58_01285 [Clostridia bacterium]|nr:hypothetical protein [Clostridia bacterium]